VPPAKPHEGRLGRGANVVFDPLQTFGVVSKMPLWRASAKAA